MLAARFHVQRVFRDRVPGRPPESKAEWEAFHAVWPHDGAWWALGGNFTSSGSQFSTVARYGEGPLPTVMDDAVTTLQGSLPNVSSRVREGDNSAHEVIEEATESNSNLIMLGSKGKKAIKRFLLGSMTSHVARHAHCSVWVVRD